MIITFKLSFATQTQFLMEPSGVAEYHLGNTLRCVTKSCCCFQIVLNLPTRLHYSNVIRLWPAQSLAGSMTYFCIEEWQMQFSVRSGCVECHLTRYTALSQCLQWQSKLSFLLLQYSCSPLLGDNNIWTSVLI